jgi:hypothetical protein
MPFRTSDDEIIEDQQAVAVQEPPTFRGSDDEVIGGDVSDSIEFRKQVMDDIYHNPDKLKHPAIRSQMATELINTLDDPEDFKMEIENSFFMSELFGIDLFDAQFMAPGIAKELYGESLEKMSASVVNRNLRDDIKTALRETPLNLKIGTIGLGASTLEAIKRRAIQLAGGGISEDIDAAVRSQFEAITPQMDPATGSLRNPLDGNNFLIPPDRIDFLRADKPLPGSVAGAAMGLVTRLPDIGAKILRGKQKDLTAAQDIATMSNAPITKLMRVTVQSGVPSMGAAVGISLLTGNPLVGLAMLGESEGGAAFQAQLEAGGSVRKSLIIGELSEAAEIGGEMLVLPGIIKGFKEGLSVRRGLTLIAENATQEGITGFNQTFLEVFGKETTKGTDKSLAAKKAIVAGLAAMPENAFVGGVVGGGAASVGVGVDLTRRGVQNIKQVANAVKKDIAVEEAPEVAPEQAPSVEVTPEPSIEVEGEVQVNAEAIAEEKPKLTKTKVVDEKGEPLTVFHGTPEGFDEFDITQSGKNTENINAEGAIFFSDDPEIAATFSRAHESDFILEAAEIGIEAKAFTFQSSNIRPAKLNIENPLILDRSPTREQIDQAKEDGFDGIIVKTDGATEYAVFSADQIISTLVVQPSPAQAQEARPATIKSDDNFDDFFEGFEADEVIERKAPAKADVQSTAATKKQITEAVRNDPVFQAEAEAIELQSQEIQLGKAFIPEKFRGEVKIHLEGDPSLRKHITFKRSEGTPFDQIVMEGFGRNKTGVEETSGELDVTSFLQRLSETKAARKKIGGIPQIVLHKMMSSGDPFSEIAAMRHDMFHKGFTVAEINEATASIEQEHKIEIEPLLETKEDVETRGRLSKRAPGEKGKLTRAERKAATTKKETAAQLKSRIKKLHKSTGVPVETIAEILRTNKEQKDVARELREAQEEGQAVGFRAGEKESREKAKVEILKLKQAQNLTDARRKTASELVKTFVEKDKRGDFLKRVAEAKSPRDLEKITAAVEKGVLRAEKRDAVNRLKVAIKAINPKKMLPEFAGTAQSILDSLQLGKIRPETELKNAEMRAMAQQVLDTAREDSVAAFQAQQILTELSGMTAKTFAINQLSIESLDQITNTLIALRFQNEADTIAAKDENAKEAIRRRSAIKREITAPPSIPANLGGEASSKVLKKFKLIHDNLESVSDAVSGARPGTYKLWSESKRAMTEFVYDVIDTGVDNQVLHADGAKDLMREIEKDNGVTSKDILNWSMRPKDISLVSKAFGHAPKPEVHTFTLKDNSGKAASFEFTSNEIMSIFMHTRNSHNLAVLLNDGMDRVTKGVKEKMRGFTVEIVENMIDTLTPQQKKVARQVGSKVMDGHNKEAINEVSARIEFIDIANVENYWPARRSIVRGPKGKKLAGSNQLVESMGLLKERVGTSNPLKLAGFFETVFNSSISSAKYVGLAEPLREVKAVYTPDVIVDMEDKGRSAEAKRITQFIERIEGQLFEGDELSDIVARMLGGFAKSKLFLNAKIAPRQQVSEFLISSYVDPKYMAEFRGIPSKADIQAVRDLSPQMKARFDSLQFDRDVGDAFQRNSMMNWLTGETSLIDHTALGMKFFDTNAIVDLYRATKAEVVDNNPDVAIDSEAGQALLKDRFEWVVRHTQPVWNVKDRSLLGSSLSPLTRSLTMFMSQREQLVRMVNNGVSDYVNSKKTNEDALRLGRILGSVAMNLAAFTAYNLAWAVLIKKRHKDVADAMRDAVKDVLSLPFFGGWFAEAFGYYFNIFADKPTFGQSGFQDGTIEGILKDILLDGIGGFALAGKHFVTEEKYKSGPNKGKLKWKTELFVAIDSMANAIASLKGLPYYGAKDIAQTVIAQTKTDDKKKKAPKF